MKNKQVVIKQFIVMQGWCLWKEATLIAETKIAFKIKTLFGGTWLSKTYYKYYEIED